MNSSENLPPLDQQVIDEVNGLWPEMRWTQQLRSEWRRTLSRHDSTAVLQALRDHFATSSRKNPVLSDVLKILKAGMPVLTSFEWRVGEEVLESDRRRAIERLNAASAEEREMIAAQFRGLGMSLIADWKVDAWPRARVLMASATLDRIREKT